MVWKWAFLLGKTFFQVRSVSFREGTHIGRIEQPEKYGFFCWWKSRDAVIDYLPEHRRQLLNCLCRTDSSGMTVPMMTSCLNEALDAVDDRKAIRKVFLAWSTMKACQGCWVKTWNLLRELPRLERTAARALTYVPGGLRNVASVEDEIWLWRICQTHRRRMERSLMSDVLGHTHAMKERIPFNQSVLCDFIGFLGVAQVVLLFWRVPNSHRFGT